MAHIVSVNISTIKGTKKRPVDEARVIANMGLENDAHASAETHRQVSLLAIESINKMKSSLPDIEPGDFGENITTSCIELIALRPGDVLEFTGGVLLEVTQLGKVCHGKKCEIFVQVGDCVMPREGIFARVINGGTVKNGEGIEVRLDGKAR